MEYFSNPFVVILLIIIISIIGILLISLVLALIFSFTIYFMKLFGISFRFVDYKD